MHAPFCLPPHSCSSCTAIRHAGTALRDLFTDIKDKKGKKESFILDNWNLTIGSFERRIIFLASLNRGESDIFLQFDKYLHND